jgi:beta-mannosidase
MNGALREAQVIVKERRNHPSLVLWQGGEEIIHMPEHLEGSNLSLMFAIGDAIRPLTSTPFFPLSSMSHPAGKTAGFKSKESIHAGGRFYGLAQQSIEEYYPKLDFAIVPELMVSSAPNVESIKKFIPPDELWPPGPSWGYHWADLDVFALFNFEIFGDTRMNSLEEFVEATQIAQGTEFQFALEQFRRRKPRTSGTGICHFITYWPDFKWGLVDYYGERKRSFEMVRRAYQPLLVSLEYGKRRWMPGEPFHAGLWVVNDYYEEYPNCKVRLRVVDRNGKSLEEKTWPVKVAPDSSAKIGNVDWTLPASLEAGFRVHLSLVDGGGRELSANEYAFLIGNEEEARKARLELREKYIELRNKYGRTYYRFFPQLVGDDKRNQ